MRRKKQVYAADGNVNAGEGNASLADSKEIRRKKNKRYLLSFLIKILLIAAVVYVVFTRVFGFYYVHGEDMFPSVKDGDLMLYYRIKDTRHIGDVVVVEKNGEEYIGRIVAQAGDEVDMDENGQLYLNGAIQSEEIFFATMKPEGDIEFPYLVSDNCFFLLADYRTAGTDSRTFGEVNADEIKGTAMTILRRRGI